MRGAINWTSTTYDTPNVCSVRYAKCDMSVAVQHSHATSHRTPGNDVSHALACRVHAARTRLQRTCVRAQLRAEAWGGWAFFDKLHHSEPRGRNLPTCLPHSTMNISSFIPPSSKRQENFSSLSNSCFSLLSSRSQQLITCFVTWPIYTFTILLEMSSYGSSSCASNGSAKRFIHHFHIPWTVLTRPDIALPTPSTARKPVTFTRTILLQSLDQNTVLRDALPHIPNTRIPLRVKSNSKT
jgi:hypothetical protein